MIRLWKWILIYSVICLGLLYTIPHHLLDFIQTPSFGNSTGYRVMTIMLCIIALITLIRFPFRMHLPALVAGCTAMCALLFITGHVVFAAKAMTGLKIFAGCFLFSLLTIKAGLLYGEEISAIKESSAIHLSQAVEFLILYCMGMIRFLPHDLLLDFAHFLKRLWLTQKPLIDQIMYDLLHLFQNIFS